MVKQVDMLALCCFLLLIFSSNSASSSAPQSAARESTKTSSNLDQPAGDWISDWGPVSIRQSADGNVTGSWTEGKDKIGKIIKGTYDKTKRVCVFDFLETWTKKKGTATLKLSNDGKKLSGSWIRGKDKGTWEMKR